MRRLASGWTGWKSPAVQRAIAIIVAGGLGFFLNSCFLISIPVKATGEIIEKSAYATGEAAASGMRRMTTPDGEDRTNVYESSPHSTAGHYPEGNAGYYDAQGNPIR